MEEEDNIRKPDKSYMDILDDDMELNLALEISLKEIEEEFNEAIQISKNKYYDDIEDDIKEESLIFENNRLRNLEKKYRIESLSNFSNLIKRLNYSSEELELKKYIESILNDYFELKIDSIKLDENWYNKIFNLIDSYYTIPKKKNFKKTLISKEEDTIIRLIFLQLNP